MFQSNIVAAPISAPEPRPPPMNPVLPNSFLLPLLPSASYPRLALGRPPHLLGVEPGICVIVCDNALGMVSPFHSWAADKGQVHPIMLHPGNWGVQSYAFILEEFVAPFVFPWWSNLACGGKGLSSLHSPSLFSESILQPETSS